MNDAPPANWFRGFLQGKTRIVAAWIFAILLVISAREYPTFPGLVICAAGAAIRTWASGYLRKDSKLAVGGPYSHLRNPLYFGTYLMAIGAALSVQAYPLFLAGSVLFAVVYHFIILDEETKLAKFFGDAYVGYSGLVPRFFPRLTPAPAAQLLAINPDPEHHRFSRELARKNKWHEPFLTFFALVAALYVVAWAWGAGY